MTGDDSCRYLRIDELAMVRVAAEVINTPLIDAVPDNDSAIYMDREANIRRGYLDRQEVYSPRQFVVVGLDYFVGGISKCHRTKGCCTWCIHVGKERVLDHQLHLSIMLTNDGVEY
jgi:hypothetical protein